MSSNGSGAGGAVAVLGGMALVTWIGYIIAIMAIGAFVVTALAAVIVVVGVVAYLKGIWECASEGNLTGIAVLTALPPVATLFSFLIYINSPIADYFVTATRESMIPYGHPSAVANLVNLLVVLAALACIVIGPVGAYIVATDDKSDSVFMVALTSLPWVYLGCFSGFCYAAAQVYGW